VRKSNYQFYLYIVRNIYSSRKKILFTTLLFSLSGILLSFTITKKYQSELIFTLNNESKGKTALSGLSSITGISLDQNDEIINPELYKFLFRDFRFNREILKLKLNDKLSLYQYLINKDLNFYEFILNIPQNIISKILSLIISENKNSINNLKSEYSISKEEKALFNKINEMVILDISESSNEIYIRVIDEDPLHASIIARKVFEILQNRIIKISTKSAEDVFKTNKKNYLVKKREYIDAQDKLADFVDKNQMISSSRFNNELKRLEANFNLINSIFQEISKQYELSRIQITKDTPVFTILKDAEIPIKKSEPNRLSMFIIFSFLGFSISISYILLYRKGLKLFNEIINEK
tara:strand:- start:2036 stop:3088 length:1053 start_codon:yes stop_codon:yes gene_type:complete